MQTKRYSSKTASIRFLIGYLLITSTLMSHPTTKPICHWQEAENFSSVSINDDRAISSKPPASGSKSTSGAIFIEAGSKLQYDIVLEKAIPGAKMVLRYARLHFRENMPPAKFMLSISTGGSAFHQSFVCGDTHGWGTLKSAEWSYLEVPLQEDLDPGPLEITITAMEDSSNVNFDGFYISNPAFKIQPEETHGVERIRFSNTGYIGLKIAGDTVIPGAFDGFEIVGRSFPSEKIKVSAFMEDPQGKKISILDTVSFATDNSRKSVAVGAGAFAGIPDGFYELKLIAGDNPELLRFPLTVLGDLVTRAREESQAFHSTAELFKVSRISGEQAFVPDLEHAAEYLDNTILLLEARQQGKATSSERTAALAYFERSKARTSKDFAEDMEAIIEQTKTSLSQIAKTEKPYDGRYGDFRRAFRSTATGILEPYRIFIPEAYDSAESMPLLLMLHGGGGDENYHPDLDNGAVKQILSKRPYVMLSPRSTSWYEGPGLDDLVQLIQETLENYGKTDASRVYSTGVSRGGWGSFQLALHDPDLLAGIACVSSAPNITKEIEKLRGMPMLFINGGADVVVDPDRARKMSKQLEARGIPHRLKIYPEAGHEYNTEEYLNLSLDFFEGKDDS